MGSQEVVVERSTMLGMPAEHTDAWGTRAHMRRERAGFAVIAEPGRKAANKRSGAFRGHFTSCMQAKAMDLLPSRGKHGMLQADMFCVSWGRLRTVSKLRITMHA